MKKLFVDSHLNPPNETWDAVRTYDDALRALVRESYEVISVNNDLREIAPKRATLDVFQWLSERKHKFNLHVPTDIFTHIDDEDWGVVFMPQVLPVYRGTQDE
jgi:hypothetical protein